MKQFIVIWSDGQVSIYEWPSVDWMDALSRAMMVLAWVERLRPNVVRIEAVRVQ